MNPHLPFVFLVCFLSGSLHNLTEAEPLKGANVRTVPEGKYSSVVSISDRIDINSTEKLHRCTGVLITRKFVLTAAHCFAGRLLGEIQLIIGSLDLRNGTRYDPSMWITYNEWAASKNITIKHAVNDIAIIKLSDKVNSKIAKPARLSSKKHDDLHYETVTLLGWGLTDECPQHPSRYLREIQVKILPNKICENIAYDLLGYNVFIPKKDVCTKEEYHALLAEGDSGGPVMRKNSVVGINRGTYPRHVTCDSPEFVRAHKLNVHASIDFYRKFITDVLKNY